METSQNKPKRKYKKHKTDYKVGITYYVDDRSKAVKKLGLDCYPVYLSIRVKRFTTSIRSRINISIAKENLQKHLDSSDYGFFAKYEMSLIEDSIRNFEPDKNENFTIQEWYAHYKIGSDFLWFFVIEGLNNKLYEYLSSDPQITITEKMRSEIIEYSALYEEYSKLILIFLKALELKGDEKASALLKEYNTIGNKEIYQTWISGVMRQDFTLWDYHSGFFRTTQLKAHKVDDAFFDKLETTLSYSKGYKEFMLAHKNVL